ncbi:Uncharacterised protein [Mycobacteroides abscessus subsp. abscessus]|nr:Uncharacterised protein [Mycobacteroides abscessus subsp. abscessus]
MFEPALVMTLDHFSTAPPAVSIASPVAFIPGMCLETDPIA